MLRYLPWAVTAVLILVAASLATQNIVLRNLNASLRTERELAEVAHKMTHNQLGERSLLAEKMISDLGNRLRRSGDLSRLSVTALAAPGGAVTGLRGVMVWDPEQQTGLLTAEQLPAAGETQDYQLWIVGPTGEPPVNGGVLPVPADGKVAFSFKPREAVKPATTFVIRLARKGGASQPEGTVVLLGK